MIWRSFQGAIALWFVSVAPVARAQITYVTANASVGLTHANTYGQTFDFADIRPPFTPSIGKTMQRNLGNGAAVGDFDNDGDDDVYLLGQTGLADRLYRNDFVGGRRVFTDVTAMAGVGDLGFGRVAHFADLDNDGWNDLVLINDDLADGTQPPCKIFRNNRDGSFADVTGGSGFSAPGVIKGGACLGDYDGDGLLDIYVTFWLFYGTNGPSVWEGYNRLFRNLGDFHFEDVTLAVGLGMLGRDSFSCAFADFDNDGDSDLYVAIDHSSDAYYRNDSGVFSDQTISVGATHGGNDMGIAVADFDNDGDLDVYSTNITDPGTSSPFYGTGTFNTLLINRLAETGTMSFVDQAGPLGVRDTAWGWGTEWLDADNDGDLDLYAVNGFDQWIKGTNPFHPLLRTPEVLFENDGTGRFTRAVGCGADVVYDARAAIAFDYDRDGLQDLLVTNTNQPTVLLKNQTPKVGHWISVKGIGLCGNNTNAVGGRIFVTIGGTTHMREIIAGGSYLSGRPFEQHFGLGSVTAVERLRIVFPDGTEFAQGSLPVDRRFAVYHETVASPARLIVSRDLRDAARLQRCIGASRSDPIDPACGDFDANGDDEVGLGDVPAFLDALNWTLPGCVSP